MRKILLRILLAGVLLFLPGCKETEKNDIAYVISTKGAFDATYFHQAAWSGIEMYAVGHGLNYTYYEPEVNAQKDFERIIKVGADAGTDLFIMPGYPLDITTYNMQDLYPEKKFVLLDGIPNNGEEEIYREYIADNTLSIVYAEEQAGFLAGYAAVKEGFRELGFFGGMAAPAVMRFGYGYIYGADYAARELDLEPEEVTLKYLYCGSYSADPEYQTRANIWYLEGTEVIFSCGGSISDSVIAAAEEHKAWVIGVDVDQSEDSEQVLTSAAKMITESVYTAIEAFYEGAFEGGKSLNLGIRDNGVGLTMATSRFTHFTMEDYENIYAFLEANGEALFEDLVLDEPDAANLPVTYVKVVMDYLR